MIPVTTFRGKHVALFGLGGSGIVTALALAAGGARVSAWDDSVDARNAAADKGIDIVDLDRTDWSGFAALVLAPGVPLTHPVPHWTVDRARAIGVESGRRCRPMRRSSRSPAPTANRRRPP